MTPPYNAGGVWVPAPGISYAPPARRGAVPVPMPTPADRDRLDALAAAEADIARREGNAT